MNLPKKVKNLDLNPLDEQEILIRYGRLAPHARDRVLDQFYLIRPGGASLHEYVITQMLTMAAASISLYVGLLAICCVLIKLVGANNIDQAYVLLSIMVVELSWVFWTIRQRYGKRYKEKIFETTELGLSPTGINLHSRIIHGGFVTKSMRWRDISSLDFVEGIADQHKPERGNRLELRDSRGRKLTLVLDCIQTIEERKILREFIFNHVPHADIKSAVDNLLRVGKTADLPFTKLWSQALQDSRPRLSTAPLRNETVLQQGRFVIKNCIGGGGQGAVYLSSMRDLEEEREVVLKEYVLPDLIHDIEHKAACEQFEKEVHLLGRLKHKSVINLIDAFVEDHRAYLVLDHVSGISLRDYVQHSGRLETKRVLQLAQQMADILCYLHQAAPSVMHLDFSPENILISTNDQLTVIDFNISAEENSIRTRTVMGKQRYMAPEQYRGKPTQRSDIYSMGATLFYLLTGQEPEPISASKPGKHLPDLDPEVNNFVVQATALEEDQRFQNIEELKRALAHLVLKFGIGQVASSQDLLPARAEAVTIGPQRGFAPAQRPGQATTELSTDGGELGQANSLDSFSLPNQGNKVIVTYKAHACPAELVLPYSLQELAPANLAKAWHETRFLLWLMNMDSPAMITLIIIALGNLLLSALLYLGVWVDTSQGLHRTIATFLIGMPGSLLVGYLPVYSALVLINLQFGHGRRWMGAIIGPTHIGLTDSGFKLWWRGLLFYNYPSLSLWSDIYSVDLIIDQKYNQPSLRFIYQSGYGRKQMILPLSGFGSEEDAAVALDYFAKYVDLECQGPIFQKFGQVGFSKIAKLLGLSQLAHLMISPEKLESISTEKAITETVAQTLLHYLGP
jgi:serine/threonine protein kinase